MAEKTKVLGNGQMVRQWTTPNGPVVNPTIGEVVKTVVDTIPDIVKDCGTIRAVVGRSHTFADIAAFLNQSLLSKYHVIGTLSMKKTSLSMKHERTARRVAVTLPPSTTMPKTLRSSHSILEVTFGLA